MTMPAQTTPKSPDAAEVNLERFQIWPDLQFWYGLTFTELWEMPHGLRHLYEFNLPRLKAERQAAALDASAYPHIGKDAQRSMVRRLELQMGHVPGSESDLEQVTDEADAVRRAKAAQIGMQFVDSKGNPVPLEDVLPENQEDEDDDSDLDEDEDGD